MLAPTTNLGRWSVLAIGVFVAGMGAFAALVAAGQRGGDEFFDNMWLTGPVLVAFCSAVAALVLGSVALATRGERALAVVASVIIGLGVALFGLLEVLFPH